MAQASSMSEVVARLEGGVRTRGQLSDVKSTVIATDEAQLQRINSRISLTKSLSSADASPILKQWFPGRGKQVDELLQLLGEPADAIPPIFIYGGSGTGKTCVVREALALLGRPHAYVSCRTCHTPRLIFESLVNQLVGHIRRKANNYSSYKRLERVSDLIEALPDAADRAVRRYGSKHVSSSGTNENVGQSGDLGLQDGVCSTEQREAPGQDAVDEDADGEKGQEEEASEKEGGLHGVSNAATGKGGSLGQPANENLPPGTREDKTGAGTGHHEKLPAVLHLSSSGEAETRCMSLVLESEPSNGSPSASPLEEKTPTVVALTGGALAVCTNKTKLKPEQAKPMVYLTFDNVETLKDDEFHLLETLLSLPELSGMPNLGIICIGNVGWDVFRSRTGVRDPIPLYFPDYTNNELLEILAPRHSKEPPYKPFLSTVLPPLAQACRALQELGASLEPLYARFSKPIREGRVPNPDSAQAKQRLHKELQPHLKAALGDPAAAHFSAEILRRDEDVGLPLCGRFLLLAAYIASRNPATLDASVFDLGDGRTGKKARRSSHTAQEKREREIHETQMKGPGTFPLERLLAIYGAIMESDSNDLLPASIFSSRGDLTNSRLPPGTTNSRLPLGTTGSSLPPVTASVRSPERKRRGSKGSPEKTINGGIRSPGKNKRGRIGSVKTSIGEVGGSLPDGASRTAPGDASGSMPGGASESMPGGAIGSAPGGSDGASAMYLKKGDISAEVLMQLATLVKAGLVATVGTDVINGASSFWCRVDEDWIRKIASSVHFPLARYLQHG